MLHDDLLASKYRDSHAVFVGEHTLSQLCLDSIHTQLDLLLNQSIRLSIPDFGVRLKKSSSSGTTNRMKGKLDWTSENEPSLQVPGGLVLDVEIGFIDSKGALSDVFSDVHLIVNNIGFVIDVISSEVYCEAEEANFIPEIKPRPESEVRVILAKYGKTQEELSRVEGLIGYSSIQVIIAKALERQHRVDLDKLFPGLILEGPIELAVMGNTTQSQRALVIVPSEGIRRRPSGDQGCVDDGMGRSSDGTSTRMPFPETGDSEVPVGRIELGMPTPADTSRLRWRHSPGVGDLGLYVPPLTVSAFGDDNLPAIKIKRRDNGLIGWRATGYAAITKLNARLSKYNHVDSIRVSLGLELDISGRLHLDLGKLGKLKIVGFHTDPVSNGEITVHYVPVIQNGSLRLKPYLSRADSGEFEVTLEKYVSLSILPFSTWGAVAAFIITKIVEKNMQFILGLEVREAIKKSFRSNAITLLDVGQWQALVGPPQYPGLRDPTCLHSGREDSLIVSVDYGE